MRFEATGPNTFVAGAVIPSPSGLPPSASVNLINHIDLMSDQTLTLVGARGAWRSYLPLFRFHYHSSFVGVLFGALIVTRDWSGPLVLRISLLYLSLNVLLYGGLYTFNAITDADSDSRRPFKDSRPVASGAISRNVVAGFVTGWEWR